MQAEKKFDRYRKSPDCMGYEYKRCNDEDDKECVGGGSKNYVYKVVEGKEKRHQQQ